MSPTDSTLDPQGFKAAFRAAFPGLPSCMNIDEARRRLEAGIRAYEAAKAETAPDDQLERACALLWRRLVDAWESWADSRVAQDPEAETYLIDGMLWKREDFEGLARAILALPALTLETRQSHVTYPSPEEGGEEGYMARCWDCDWSGPLRPRGRDGKNQARKDQEAHPVIAESRLVSAWKPVGGATTTDGDT
jgi:hypothetical protein